MKKINKEDFEKLLHPVFDMYSLLKNNGSSRKILAVEDDCGNILMMFRGSASDFQCVQELLNKIPKV